jgi:hypothetical protein
MDNVAYLHGAKNYSSVRYAFIWCFRMAEWDPSMGEDTPMRELYSWYADRAGHFGDVTIAFRHGDDVIRPVSFAVWYEIFCRVYDKCGCGVL